jgi:thiol-disulfide isomerase/thioredoxin
MASAEHDDKAGESTAEAAPTARFAATGVRPWLIAGLVLLLVVQVALLVGVFRTNAEVASLRDDIDGLNAAASAEPFPELGSVAASPQSEAPESGAAPTDSDGNLPRFLGGGADAALGRNVGQVSGLEYYSGENVVLDGADGVARAYMVWAHWCPFCQEELPMMAEWHAANADEFEGFELVSVTTAMDEAGENPLVPYLDDGQFPFPVLVDEDGSISQQLGVNAFPFWVFTAPDGTVVGRAAGLIELDDLETVFQQLAELEPVDAMGVGG